MKTLHTTIEEIESVFGVRICVHDISGITFSSRRLDLPSEWKSHCSSYCSQAKLLIGESRCMRQKERALQVLEGNGNKPYCGICNMGICDYIEPVIIDGQIVAVIFASGIIPSCREKSLQRLQHSIQKHQLSETDALSAFEQAEQTMSVSEPVLRYLAEQIHDIILRDTVPGSALKIPEGPLPIEAVETHQSGYASTIVSYLNENYTSNIRLSDLACLFFLSEGHINRLVRSQTGLSVNVYLQHLRMNAAASALEETNLSIRQIAAQSGFQDANYFTRCFKKHTGLSPMEWRALHVQDDSEDSK